MNDPKETEGGDTATGRKEFLVRTIGFFVCVLLAVFLLPMTEAEPEDAQALTARVIAQGQSSKVEEAILAAGFQSDDQIRVTAPTPEIAQAILPRSHGMTQSPGAPGLDVTTKLVGNEVQLEWKLAAGGEPVVGEAKRTVGDWTSILPPLIAILIALWYRQLILALLAAVWLGGAAGTGWNPLSGLWRGLSEFIWGSTSDTFNIYIIVFTLGLVGMVQVITRAGGIAGILDRVAHLATSARSTRLATALMGGAVFFDDYANTVVVGTTMRPMTDERRISREKLAYIVDSTSAPIAGIAIISTWIGYEVGLFDELARQLALERSGYDIFFAILPMRFYCLITLGFVFLNAWSGRDYGPMHKAEVRAHTTGETLRAGSKPLTNAAFSAVRPEPDAPKRWWNAALPIGFVIFATMFGMFWSGWSGPDEASIAPLFSAEGLHIGEMFTGFAAAAPDLFEWGAWRDSFSNADNAKVLFWAALLGSALAIALAAGQRILSPVEAMKTWFQAVPAMWMAVTILILAWSIRAVCDDLGTSIYLVGAVQDLISPEFVPLITFFLASVVAFSTGTSWGTMGILLPAMVPLAFYLTDGAADQEIILLLTFGAVLDGAIFGDHCSPISDTTVMSSISASVDHIDHVRTQAPYAVTSMLLAATFGYVGVAFGLPIWVALFAGIGGAAAILFIVGKPHDYESESS